MTSPGVVHFRLLTGDIQVASWGGGGGGGGGGGDNMHPEKGDMSRVVLEASIPKLSQFYMYVSTLPLVHSSLVLVGLLHPVLQWYLKSAGSVQGMMGPAGVETIRLLLGHTHTLMHAHTGGI